jgi:hypothetical protein
MHDRVRVRKPTSTLGSDRLFGVSTRLSHAFFRCGIYCWWYVNAASTSRSHEIPRRFDPSMQLKQHSDQNPSYDKIGGVCVCLPQQHLYGLRRRFSSCVANRRPRYRCNANHWTLPSPTLEDQLSILMCNSSYNQQIALNEFESAAELSHCIGSTHLVKRNLFLTLVCCLWIVSRQSRRLPSTLVRSKLRRRSLAASCCDAIFFACQADLCVSSKVF